MSLTLPSKRYLVLLGVLVVLILIIFGVSIGVKFVKNNKLKKQEAKQELIKKLITLRSKQGLEVLSVQDTDSDGLPDWKEALWQLDPKNPDTDGNGVKDGDQIKLIEQELQKKSGIIDEKELTPTDQIARDIYTAVTILNQSGQLNDETTEALVEQITSSVQAVAQVKQYTQNDLIIVPTTEQNSIAYAQNLTKVLGRVKSSDIQAIVETAAVTNPEDANPEITASILDKYQEINKELLAMKVPAKRLTQHLELLNTMELLYSNMSGIAHGSEDPLLGLVGSSQLPGTLAKLAEIAQQ